MPLPMMRKGGRHMVFWKNLMGGTRRRIRNDKTVKKGLVTFRGNLGRNYC